MTETSTSSSTAPSPAQAPRIVVGVDGSPASKEALRWAARLAPHWGARIDALAVWESLSTYGWSSLPPLMPPHPQIEKALIEAVDEVFGADRPADLTTRVVSGAAPASLVYASRGALLMILGSRGLGGVPGLLLGSVSRRAAELAECPVLVVHDPARNEGER